MILHQIIRLIVLSCLEELIIATEDFYLYHLKHTMIKPLKALNDLRYIFTSNGYYHKRWKLFNKKNRLIRDSKYFLSTGFDTRMRSTTNNHHSSGFTLIELLIVVIIIATIASIAVPQLFQMQGELDVVAANKTVKSVQQKIDEYFYKNGSWPTEVDIGWFRRKAYPRSPFAPDNVGNTININDSPTKWHPGYKTLGTYPPFWYCRGNGSFRIRVPTQATDAETLELYNAANDTNASSLSDTSK